MQYTGKVVAKIQQEGGPSASFARIQIGSKKSGNAAKLRFFDVPDQEELNLGDKLVITITRAPKQPAVAKVIEFKIPGGCVSIPERSLSEQMQAELEPLPIQTWYKCGGCGVDLSKHPTSASAHVCPIHFDRVAEGEIPNENKRFCV